jgi:hypothetical protein
MEKLTELYNELLDMGADVFSGGYCFSGDCDSMVIQLGDAYGVFLDIDRIRTLPQELEAVSHEWAHIVTGSTYTLGATAAVRQRSERRAARAQIRRVLPFEELRAAVLDGCQEIWQLADRFSVSEDFVREAIDYYTGPCGLRF